ncbi:MAG: nickel-responsive transcriptional regulator NikR [Deltaproteobacteria bacterium]|nr:nickel-responsive transcriptional regulator NikR [Deltaproteobacteria bacterium]MBW2308402.1 nickel-responsive transcriptional regulator NikR [Deltaproteobacteria bacterium]
MERKLLQKFDQTIHDRHYANRSEAIRDLIRDYLVSEYVEQQMTTPSADARPIIGTLTLVYNHDMYDLNARLTALQHDYHETILSSMHVHLDFHHCLEVLALKGPASIVRDIANQITGARGVLHGKLTTTVVSPDFC